MKFCLNSRQTAEYLKKADEIKFEYRDRKALPDFFEKYPEATFVLIMNGAEDIDQKELEEYNILSQGRLTFCIGSDRETLSICQDIGAKFYYGFPITSFWELRSAIAAGVSYAILGAPLFFMMDRVKALDIPIRAIPNVAHYNYIPTTNGICGTWIRPEDLDLYEDYISMVEFEDCDQRKEQALFRIYAEQKTWPGEITDIISNLNASGTNRIILPEFGQRRLNCGQRCQDTGACRICERSLRLANPELLRNYAEEKNLI